MIFSHFSMTSQCSDLPRQWESW